MRALVTGANGFIGSRLISYLVRLNKYKISALVREKSNLNSLSLVKNRINIIKIDKNFKSINRALSGAKPDIVIHLAALTLVGHKPEDIKLLISSNILFPSLLVEAMIKNRVKYLVNTGTFWEYTKDKHDYSPFNLYAATKVAFENFLKYYAVAKDIRCVTLKLYGTYGPNDPRTKIFSYFKKSLTSKKPILFSPGKQRLDLVYIDDVIDAYEKATRYVYKKQNSTYEYFFIGSGRGVALRRIADIYEECVGKHLNINWGGLPYRAREIMCSHADIRLAKIKLNWEPKFDLRSGISKMLEIEEVNYEKNFIACPCF